MNHGMIRDRVAIALLMCASLEGCQLVKKLTGRGDNDSGTTHPISTAPILGDASTGPSPVIALPNPNVAPLPTQMPTPTPDADASVAVAAADVTVPTAPPTVNSPTNVAVVDAGIDPAAERGHHRIDNYCKEHPGRMNPRTHLMCPI